jgi:hypothetical protein
MAENMECSNVNSEVSEQLSNIHLDNVDSNESINEANNFPIPYAFEPILEGNISTVRPTGTSCVDSETDSVLDQDAEPDYDSEPEQDRRTGTFWCSCGNCAQMTTQTECVCCREVARIQHRIVYDKPDGHAIDLQCITNSDRFVTICLDIDVLDVSLLLMKDVVADTLVRPIASR